MKKYSCIIVDDELDAREVLGQLIQRHCPELMIKSQATNLSEARELLQEQQPDILFLDVELGPDLIFDLLDHIDLSAKLIFTTAHDHYALPAIKVKAVDYLLKPIRPKDLIRSVNKAKEEVQRDQKLEEIVSNSQNKHPDRLSLPIRDTIRLTVYDEIIYLRADVNYTRFYLQDGEELLVAYTLKRFEELLDTIRFFRVHQSYLVNTIYIKEFSIANSELLMKNGTRIPVARSKKKALKAYIRQSQ